MNYKEEFMIKPILEMRKLRLEDVKWLAQHPILMNVKANLHARTADSSVQRVPYPNKCERILKRTNRIYHADSETLKVFYKTFSVTKMQPITLLLKIILPKQLCSMNCKLSCKFHINKISGNSFTWNNNHLLRYMFQSFPTSMTSPGQALTCVLAV